MTFYSAFAWNAFQRNAFQIANNASSVAQASGGRTEANNDWRRQYHEDIAKHYARESEYDANLKAIEKAKEERIKLEARLAAQRKRDYQELTLVARAKELEHQVLMLEQQNILITLLLEQYRREEEEISIILMSII